MLKERNAKLWIPMPGSSDKKGESVMIVDALKITGMKIFETVFL
jgi:hypothetical protein